MDSSGVDYTIWSKHEDIEIQTKAKPAWHSVVEESGTEMYRSTENATALRAPKYRFTGIPAGQSIYFYMLVTQAGSAQSPNEQLSSLKNQMIMLDCDTPSNIDPTHTVKIIGVETSRYSHSLNDFDFNDVVFLIEGEPEVPDYVKVDETSPVVESRTVRYLIEDLGSTDDFDFNDIVVDVEQSRNITPTLDEKGYVKSWSEGDWTQKATIRHLGGTLKFTLTIGNTTLPEHEGVLGSNPDEEYEISGWNPDTHNISVEVSQKESNGYLTNTVTFPKAGEAPMIIAVSPVQEWMSERVSIPESWFYIPEESSED